MDQRLADLLQQFSLERLEVNLFRGESRDIGSPQVFGGQVLGQALMAAYSTVADERVVHSLHAYFLRRGDFNRPIVYQVDRSRDGGSFSSRRVIAIQHGEQIFTFSASFQEPEEGFEHQVDMPDVPPPESLADSTRPPADVLEALPEKVRRFMLLERPFELRRVEPIDVLQPRQSAPLQNVWLRAVDRLPDDDRLHRSLLAYVSDYNLLATATLPHAVGAMDVNLVTASLDHAMWFHRPFRVDDWLLYSMDSPSAGGARGFTRGSVFSRDGRLVASTAQEGLIRLVAKRPA
ncbi:MAG: acyl-CoA thioesterase II [Steroidobacteraceae bacterium]|jgi:acyl-CoA thioesterase-2|nr:acyl-CoA thioesterase II [Steroidobacteraceae bacterium]